MFGRSLIRCGRSEQSPDEGNGEGIESLPPSEVAEKRKIEINVK